MSFDSISTSNYHAVCLKLMVRYTHTHISYFSIKRKKTTKPVLRERTVAVVHIETKHHDIYMHLLFSLEENKKIIIMIFINGIKLVIFINGS